MSLRGVKRRSNPQTINSLFIHKKEKEFYERIITCSILRLPQAFGLRNDKLGLCAVIAMLRLPRVLRTLAMTMCSTIIKLKRTNI